MAQNAKELSYYVEHLEEWASLDDETKLALSTQFLQELQNLNRTLTSNEHTLMVWVRVIVDLSS